MTAPLSRTLSAQNVAAAAITTDTVLPVGEAPYAGVLTEAAYIPRAALSGVTTNGRTLNLYNRGQTGAGAVLMATLALITGVDLVAHDKKNLTLSATPANLVVVQGDVLEFESLHTGTGITDPGGQFFATIGRTGAS